jgi:hypothetical protein
MQCRLSATMMKDAALMNGALGQGYLLRLCA